WLSGRRRNLAYIGLWCTVFVAMSSVHGVGDTHPGRWLPFWQDACSQGRRNGCRVLLGIESIYCKQGSGWACNDLGILLAQLRQDGLRSAAAGFGSACKLGTRVGCENLAAASHGDTRFRRTDPTVADYLILLQEGKGPLSLDLGDRQIYARACGQGWSQA